MTCFTGSDSFLDLILRVNNSRFRIQMPINPRLFICLISSYFWSLKKVRTTSAVIPTLLTRFGCKYPQIKAESLHIVVIIQ